MELTERYSLSKPPAMCRECGVKVQDFDIHNGFHNWLRTIEGLTATNAKRHGLGAEKIL